MSAWRNINKISIFPLVTASILLLSACSLGGEPPLAYVSGLNGEPEVALLDTGARNSVPLANIDGPESDPRWSPDREQVAFVAGEAGNREIMAAGPRGEAVTRLTISAGDDLAPRWSPDGARLAFISNRDSQPEIYMMDADGSNPTRVTTNHSRERMGGWSPDGSWLVFYSLGGESEQGLWLRNPDGVNLVRLTDGDDTDPSWSPDGNSIAFVRGDGDNADVFVASRPRDASWYGVPELTQLTDNHTADLSPSWSPNGKSIVFVAHRDGSAEIYTMRPDGSDPRRLTSNESDDFSPVWSRNGKKIAFVSRVYGTGEIFVMDTDGANQFRLTNNQVEDHSPRW